MCDISSIHLSLNSVKKQVVFLKVIESPDVSWERATQNLISFTIPHWRKNIPKKKYFLVTMHLFQTHTFFERISNTFKQSHEFFRINHWYSGGPRNEKVSFFSLLECFQCANFNSFNQNQNATFSADEWCLPTMYEFLKSNPFQLTIPHAYLVQCFWIFLRWLNSVA